ncbi:2476_t:CDS:2 [Dentiscutata heterogama]|uniref:2476_t:CDS:1 n=1 Tax=Dentiscutata heterogama TaxID=1316150 RepID=A0ACA9LZC3_9GLOM|nr:2476_t:CDS:2 [Dentiscutata heterogama]
MSFDDTASDEDFDLQYLITFKHNYYSELIIDHELVRVTVNAINEEQEFMEESDEDTNIEVSTGRGYTTLPYELQLGIILPLSLFQLFFTNEQLCLIVENTNIYKQVKGRVGGQVWNLLTLNELKIWLGLIIYMGVHHINAMNDLWNRDDKKVKLIHTGTQR